MHVIAAKAVTFYETMQPKFVDYQRATLDNALTMANELKSLNMCLVSGGTDTHLMLINLTQTGITGKEAEEALSRAGIVANRDRIPFDPLPALKTSGIRLGTPAVTTRGFGKEEMKHLASLIVKVITDINNRALQDQTRDEVKQIYSHFPIPGIDS